MWPPGRAPLDGRAGRLLELARTAVPFAAGLVAWRDPSTGGYSVLSGFGYRAELEHFLLTEFVTHDPGFSAVVDQPERTLFWEDVPDYANSVTAQSVLMPSGFREGTSFVLRRGSIPVGLVHLSLSSARVPRHARAFLNALREDLVEVAEAERSVREVGADAPGELTGRELDVLRLLAAGLTNQQIARRLAISTSTVGTHLEHVHAKLGVTNRVAAAITALRRGLID